MARLWSFLTSRNTGIVLLIAVSLVLIIGAALPNPSLMLPADSAKLQDESPLLFWLGENFNSMKIGKSPVFWLIGILLVVSTAFCSVDRVIKKYKIRNDPSLELPPEEKGITVHLRGDVNTVQELLGLLKKDRWRSSVHNSEGGKLVSARKGEIGFWGSIFFHAILVTLIAGLVVYYFTAFYATMVITEGQDLRLTKDNLTRIERMPIAGVPLPDLVFRLNRFSAEYFDDFTATDYTADFGVLDIKTGSLWNQIVKVNKPFEHAGMEFIITQRGYSPNFVLFKRGTAVFDSYVALKVGDNNTDSVDIPGEGMEIKAQFFPDMARASDGGVYSKSPRLRNPHFGLDVSKDGRRIFRGLVKLGEGVSFGEYRLVFNDLRHWVTLDLVKETGIGFFFVCAMAGLIGVFLRVLDPERRIAAVVAPTVDGQSVTFYHHSKHFEGMLKEDLDAIIHRLQDGNARA